MVEFPGKCLSATEGSNDVILAECDEFDANQLFDHSDLLVWTLFDYDFASVLTVPFSHRQNYNTNPGLLKLLGTEKCLRVSSNNRVTQVDCDITDLNEMWFVILGTLVTDIIRIRAET